MSLRLQILIQAMAALAGLGVGFKFGLQLGSLFMGVAMSLIGALFCSLLADFLIGKLFDRPAQENKKA